MSRDIILMYSTHEYRIFEVPIGSIFKMGEFGFQTKCMLYLPTEALVCHVARFATR